MMHLRTRTNRLVDIEHIPNDASGNDPSTPKVKRRTNGLDRPAWLPWVASWAERGGCDKTPDTSATPLDVSTKVAGAETSIARYGGCSPGGGAELWTMTGEGHIPSTNDAFSPSILDFFLAHPKP